MRNVVARLTEEELRRLRDLEARFLLAQGGAEGFGVGDIVAAWEFTQEMTAKYELEEDEHYDFSLVDGAISIDD